MKKFRDILGDMVTWISATNSRLTNFTPGSVIRSILEAIAMEIEALYIEIRRRFAKLQEDSTYNSFGFQKNPAIAATGKVTVVFSMTLTESVLFPVGYRFYTVPLNGKTVYFQSTVEVTAPIGSTQIDLDVVCTEAGIMGNVPAYSIRRIVSSTPYVAECYNVNRFFTGAPEETSEERKKRFTTYIKSIARATPDAITYGCSQINGIAGVHVVEDIGMIYVYAHDYDGNLSSTLKTTIENELYKYKAAGIKPLVSGVVKRNVDLTVKVLISNGYDKNVVLTKVKDSVSEYLNKMTVSKSLIRADLIRHIMDIDRKAIMNIDLGIPSDILVQSQELVRPGVIQTIEMV